MAASTDEVRRSLFTRYLSLDPVEEPAISAGTSLFDIDTGKQDSLFLIEACTASQASCWGLLAGDWTGTSGGRLGMTGPIPRDGVVTCLLGTGNLLQSLGCIPSL